MIRLRWVWIDQSEFSSAPGRPELRPWGFCAHWVLTLAAMGHVVADLDKEHVDALNKILQTDILTHADADFVFVAANSERDAISVRDRLQELEDAGEALTLENVFR